jgi:hypothetical protein
MKRTFGLLFIAVAVLATGPELNACGDKSLSAGGIRMQRAVAARYPASVLAYAPPSSPVSSAARELRLPETLRQVGHRYAEVASLSELRTSIETGRYNLVVVGLGDAADVERNLGPLAARVVVVPVAYRLTKAEVREAASQQRFLIRAPGRDVEYLATIAEAVKFGSKGSRKS